MFTWEVSKFFSIFVEKWRQLTCILVMILSKDSFSFQLSSNIIPTVAPLLLQTKLKINFRSDMRVCQIELRTYKNIILTALWLNILDLNGLFHMNIYLFKAPKRRSIRRRRASLRSFGSEDVTWGSRTSGTSSLLREDISLVLAS